MNIINTLLCVVLLSMSLQATIAAEPTSDETWDQAYEKLLKESPEIAAKVESGGATKKRT